MVAAVTLTATPSRLCRVRIGTPRHQGRVHRWCGRFGNLTFKGKNYRLSVGGVSAGTIGQVLTWHRIPSSQRGDIAELISAAVAGGAKVVTLQNSNGVVLQLRGRQVGFEASLSLSGLTISMQPQQARNTGAAESSM